MIYIFRKIIYEVIKGFAKKDSILPEYDEILIEIPKDKTHGNLYTNAAMIFAKNLNMTPMVLASHISKELQRNKYITDVKIAGYGFINFSVSPEFWHAVLEKILIEEDKYSFLDIGKGESINIEFVSANPTGPLHTGHARNAVFGSVVANLFEKIGYKVTREFYINDQGNQIKALARSVYLRYRECLGAIVTDDDFIDDMYIGDYIKDIALDLISIYSDTLLNKEENEWIDKISEFAVSRILKNIKEDLKLIGVEMDVYTSEKDICNRKLVEDALSILEENGDVYEGILPSPKGIDVNLSNKNWEERPQTLFLSTKYGDEIDRPIRKSDGSWTYFAGDIAYHLDKIKRGYTKIIDLLGADHNGYTKRLKASVKALSRGKVKLDIRLYQLVNILDNGHLIKMSKRAGSFITLREVIEKVGKDITRFMMLSRHHDVMIDFDFKKVVEFSMENPIFYIQYAYARICSVFRHAGSILNNIDKETLIDCNKSCLVDEAEIDLMKELYFWPYNLVCTAKTIEPHRISHYLHNIAYFFHALWNKGKTNAELRFIDKNNNEITLARLSLLESTRIVLEDGLKLMGITPLEEMR